MDRGAQTEAIDKSGIPLFYHAIKCSREKMAEVLIQGLSVEALNAAYGPDSSTALHLAVEKSMSSIVHLLIDLGANPVALDSEKRKPVERIDYSEYDNAIQEIVDFLTLTEMSMFGSITSFADTVNSKVSKSVINLISKSAASLVSPKASQSDLLQIGTAVDDDTKAVSDKEEAQSAEEIILIPELQVENVSMNDNKATGCNIPERELTSPLLTFTGSELSEADDDDDQALSDIHELQIGLLEETVMHSSDQV
ncbi:hypothetical protein BDR26DRAFT_696845 [Obelidium mucronatum]|nr:hypothetical protein BDR26DRAFT_696845 [Obelidium mucronatum]